jgi:hypothetical protein
MWRIALLLVWLGVIAATEHRFVAGELRIYQYEVSQVVRQQTLDDALQHRSDLYWEYGLKVIGTDAAGVDLRLTVLRVRARHQGPGYVEAVDSIDSEASDAPLLGHLLGLVHQSLDLRWETDGGVVRVQADQLPERLAPPGDSRRSAAERFYGGDALTALWQAALLVPGQAPTAWAPPFAGKIDWNWQDRLFQISAEVPMTCQLGAGSTAFEAVVTALSGQGEVTIDDQGVLQKARGQAAWTLRMQALTQAVEQQHELQWQTVLWRHKPAGVSEDPGE